MNPPHLVLQYFGLPAKLEYKWFSFFCPKIQDAAITTDAETFTFDDCISKRRDKKWQRYIFLIWQRCARSFCLATPLSLETEADLPRKWIRNHFSISRFFLFFPNSSHFFPSIFIWWVQIHLFLSLSLSIYLSLNLSLPLYLYLSISIYLYLSLSISLSFSLSSFYFSLSNFPSISRLGLDSLSFFLLLWMKNQKDPQLKIIKAGGTQTRKQKIVG